MQTVEYAQAREGRTSPVPSDAQMAQAIVAHAYDVRLKDMRAFTRRGPRAAFARQLAMYLSHIVLGMSVSGVSAAFERHRSTVCHALHHIEDLRDDAEFDRTVLYLEALLRRATGGAA